MSSCAVPVYVVVTPAMGDVLSAIATYRHFHDRNPSMRDLCAILGHTSTNDIAEKRRRHHDMHVLWSR